MGPASQQVARLRDAGLRSLTGAVFDTGGVIRGKTVPAHRVEDFARSGMGASYTWPVFCVDNDIAMTPGLSVVGDFRLVADLQTAVVLDAGYGWAAADLCDQDGAASAYCWRDAVRRQVERLHGQGVSVLAGHELEFGLVEGGRPVGTERGWQAYGVGVLGDLGELGHDLCEELDGAGLPVEQLHAEYGVGQFEISLPPREPVRAADDVLLARTVIGRVARRHGLRASFSPAPFPETSGNGAHLHLSLHRQADPLLSGGDGAAGMTPEGERAVAGILAHLPAMMAVLAGTVVSSQRIQPGHWAGAFVCWGVENREAAVRVLQSRRGNPHGANIEVKCVDAGANTYLATAMVLGAVADGLLAGTALPAETTVDPGALDAAALERAGVVALPAEPLARIRTFAASDLARTVLGDGLHEAVLAVRRRELPLCDRPDINAATRFAWSA